MPGSDRTVDRIIGAVLRRELLKAGYVVVPALPNPEMVSIAAKAPTGNFSPWSHSLGALVPLWLNLLLVADPESKPVLDDAMAVLRDMYPASWDGKKGKR